MKKFLLLQHSFQVAILTYFISLLGFLATSFLLISRIDIPLGFLLAGLVVGTLNLIQGFLEKKDDSRGGASLTIVSISLKLVVNVAIMIIISFMFYKWNMPYFNIFTYVGIYSVSIIFTIISYIIKKE